MGRHNSTDFAFDLCVLTKLGLDFSYYNYYKN